MKKIVQWTIFRRRLWFAYEPSHEQRRSFPEAVNYLLTFHGIHRAREPPAKISPAQRKSAVKEKTTFHLPEKNTECRRVFAYLRKRGISSQVIQAFIKAGVFYEDAEHHNCVFVGRKRDGKAVFATKRGTYDLGKKSFRGDVAGSDKNIAFRLPCNAENDTLFVFKLR